MQCAQRGHLSRTFYITRRSALAKELKNERKSKGVFQDDKKPSMASYIVWVYWDREGLFENNSSTKYLLKYPELFFITTNKKPTVEISIHLCSLISCSSLAIT